MPGTGGNFKETMNGYTFGRLPGLTMKVGERVRWYLMATTGFEVHAPHWHGNTVLVHDMRTDVASLVTMGMVTADMVPDNPGTWLFHCHVGPHILAGMQAPLPGGAAVCERSGVDRAGRATDRRPRRPLRHRARARRGRHGHRLPRPRRAARPQGGAQGAAARAVARSSAPSGSWPRSRPPPTSSTRTSCRCSTRARPTASSTT